MGLGNATLSDEQIKGTLRVGQVVQAKHPDRKELIEATITKVQDCSQYTVGMYLFNLRHAPVFQKNKIFMTIQFYIFCL